MDIRNIGNIKLFTARLDGMTSDEIKTMADKVKEENENSVVVIGANTNGKVDFFVTASEGAVKKGIHCGGIMSGVSAVAGSSDGFDADKIGDALEKAIEIIEEQIK